MARMPWALGRSAVTNRSPADWLLGIDIGTGSVKALAVGLDGRLLACIGRASDAPHAARLV